MNVFLVDDEYWTLESIKAKVDWASYGMTVIGEAYNGIDGFNEIMLKKPDLVFTDIRMPGMDGLELIEKARKAGLDTQFIIISGYDEFNYAQKALHLGADGYILKSYDEEEMRPVLETAVKKRFEKQEAMAAKLMSLLMGNASDSKEEMIRILGSSGLNINMDTSLTVVVVRSEGLGLDMAPLHSSAVRISTGKYTTAFVMMSDRVEPFLSQLPTDVKGIGISSSFTILNDLTEAIQSAIEASCQSFITGQHGHAFTLSSSKFHLQDVIIKLYEAIRIKNISEITLWLDDLRHKADQGELTIRHAYQLYNSIMSFAYQAGEEEDVYLQSFEALMEMYSNSGDMFTSINSIIIQKLEWQGASRHDDDSRENTKKFVSYIKERYYENLTIHHLAEKFNFNPNYVSQLFQKELQTTFTKYLLHIRLERACLLLKETELAISEVAEKVGYSDYFYFAKVFKRSFGMTPTQYRM